MKLLVVGGGGREHAIIRKLKESPRVSAIFCAPGNGGIQSDAACVDIKATDLDKMVDFAKSVGIDLAIVTPDDPLCLGMVDAMEAAGIPAFGPTKAAAEIEGSKVFAKELMERYGIPTAAHKSFDQPEDAIAYVREQNQFPTVIKADGLALGKGVTIAETVEAAEQAIREMMEEKRFGESGSRVVVEEFLTGPEVSVLTFCDGERVIPMASSMDHKRACDGNHGPNTGGMGAIAPNPHYTDEMAGQCMKEIFLPTVEAMKAEGRPFRGCLYFGLMLTKDGPKVIEYNCRFGDPETQVVLPLLEGDLLEIMLAVREGKLDGVSFRQREGCAACVVLASGGYPGEYVTDLPIEGLKESGQLSEGAVYHAGTRKAEGRYYTAGGRVAGVTATGDTLKEALDAAYRAVDQIHFGRMHYRTDIGSY